MLELVFWTAAILGVTLVPFIGLSVNAQVNEG